MSLCNGTGWAYDPNFPSSPITVEARVYSDEECLNEVKSATFTTNILRSDLNADRRLKGNHGFDVHIPIDEDGTYYVKFFAIDTAEDGDVQIGETMAITVAPDTPRLYTDYSATNYLNGMQTTYFVWTYVNLVDNDKGTEWTTGLSRLNCTSTYVDFRSTKAFIPTGYVLYFTGNAVSNSLHKPKSWYVKACRNMEDEWTTIATVTNNDLGYGGEHEFTIDNVTVPYRYFRFEVTDANDRDANINIAELQLKGYPDGANMGYSPKGGLDRCLALSDRIMVEGWAYDPDVPSECVDVLAYVYTDAACTQELKHVSMWANFASPDVNTTHGITGKHGFHTYIPISDAGTYYVKFVAIDINTDYQFRIQARYADGSSSNFETVLFKSDGGIEPLPYEWGFEEGMGGFRVVDNVRDTRYVTFTWHEGHNAFRFSPTNGNLAPNTKNPQYLISPQFDCQSPMKVSFYYKISDDEDDLLPAEFLVGYSTTSNAMRPHYIHRRPEIRRRALRQGEQPAHPYPRLHRHASQRQQFQRLCPQQQHHHRLPQQRRHQQQRQRRRNPRWLCGQLPEQC